MREEGGERIDQKNPDTMTIPCCFRAESMLSAARIQHGGSKEPEAREQGARRHQAGSQMPSRWFLANAMIIHSVRYEYL